MNRITMPTMKPFVALALFACLAAAVLACSARSSILGDWQEIDGGEKVTFDAGGRVQLDYIGITMSGKYRFTDGEHVRMDLDGIGALAGPIVSKVEISRDELRLTKPDGDVTRYRRSK